MPKKAGDRSRKDAISLSGIMDDFANGIVNKGKRYLNFWNYKPIAKMVDPDPHKGFFTSPKKVKFAAGANRAGKTWHTVYEDVVCYTGIIPPAMQGVYAHEAELRDITTGPNKRERHVRIVVASYKKYTDTIKPILTGSNGILPEEWSNWDEDNKMFVGPDGSWLEIESVDPRERDESKAGLLLRGAYVDHTHFDELSLMGAYTESVARMAANIGGPKTVSLSYCPQHGFGCWTFETLYQQVFRYKPDRDVRKPPEECHPDIQGVILSMKDNPSISAEEYEAQKRMFKPWEVAFRCDGRYSNRTDSPFFDVETLVAWEEQERFSPGKPYRIQIHECDTERGKFKGDLVAVDESEICEGGEYDAKVIAIWRVWRLPEHGHKYVLSADIAAGNEKSDPHSLTVWDATEQEFPLEVAKLHVTTIKPGPIAIQGCLMGSIYGNCLLVPECNNTFGGIFVEKARNYRNIYSRLRSKDEAEEVDTTKLGWFTNPFNKGSLLDNAHTMLTKMTRTLKPAVDRDGLPVMWNYCPFNSRDVLLEFISFEEKLVFRANGEASTEWGAKVGEHDDTVMDAIIAFKIINHEYEKITTCKLEKKEVKVSCNLNRIRLMQEDQTRNRLFSSMPRQSGGRFGIQR